MLDIKSLQAPEGTTIPQKISKELIQLCKDCQNTDPRADTTVTMTATLSTLPSELHVQIFELLDPDTSACLGLTCTKLYGIHEEVQRRLNKNLLCERLGPFQPSSNIPALVETWMDSELVYGCPYTLGFVTHKRVE
jgi:hypothetical protein